MIIPKLLTGFATFETSKNGTSSSWKTENLQVVALDFQQNNFKWTEVQENLLRWIFHKTEFYNSLRRTRSPVPVERMCLSYRKTL